MIPVDVDKAVEQFSQKNGKFSEFTTKEVLLILHKELKDDIKKSCARIDEMKGKLERHIELREKIFDERNKALIEHDKLFLKITEEMPKKGWCGKVTSCLFPENDIPLNKKVENMYMLYRISKYLVVTATGLIILEGGRLLFSLI